MKLTFPHMGNAYISIKVLLDTLDMDYCIPPLNSRANFEKGLANSPEFICLPFKTLLGDFIWGLENGADVVLFGGGNGQCRQGCYGDLHQEILRGLGYKFDYVEINIKKMSFGEIIKVLTPLVGDKSKRKIALGVAYALRTIFAVDKLYDQANISRCEEINKGETDRILKAFENRIFKIKGYHAVMNEVREASVKIENIKKEPVSAPLKIAIVGEIFIACEPFSNLEIERKLGLMGVTVKNFLSPGEWVRERFINNIIPIHPKVKSKEAAQEFMRTETIGGHGLQTIGNCIISAKDGYDGVIHLYPFTCMPEIIAQSTFSEIQKKYDIPIMTLILDEMTGEAGYMTRLEAFVDMIRMKRQAESKQAI